MGFSGISLMLTLIVINLQLQPRDTRVSRWANVFFIQKIGGCLRVKHGLKLSHPSAVHPMTGIVTHKGNDAEVFASNPSSVPPIGHRIEFISSAGNFNMTKRFVHDNESVINDNDSMKLLREFYETKARRKDVRRQVIEEWVVLATVIDRLLCVIFAVVIILYTTITTVAIILGF